jgi:hypothetical protein
MAGFDTLPRVRSIGLAGIAIIAAACASAGGKSAQRTGCDLPDRDSVFALSGPVYRECGVDRVARRLPNNVHPDFRPTAARTACYSADLEFVVDTMGKPEIQTARIVRANDQGFAAAVVATLTLWKYEPAVREKRPVRQIVTTHESMSTAVVVVPAGSSPPTGPPRQRLPTC